MNGKLFWWAVRIMTVSMLAAGMLASAQDSPTPEHLSGIISDYTPLLPTTYSPRGPWEMRGHWSLHLKGNSGKGDFSAYMTMELSDSGVAAAGGDLTNPASRGAPILTTSYMTDATVSTDSDRP